MPRDGYRSAARVRHNKGRELFDKAREESRYVAEKKQAQLAEKKQKDRKRAPDQPVRPPQQQSVTAMMRKPKGAQASTPELEGAQSMEGPTDAEETEVMWKRPCWFADLLFGRIP